MSWIKGLHYPPFRGFAVVSTAVGVYVGWRVFTADSPEKNEAAQMKLKYAAVDSPRVQKLAEMDVSSAISKEIADANASVLSLKVGSVAADPPVLEKVTEETTDVPPAATSEETTSSDSAEALPSSTMPTTSSETTDVPPATSEATTSSGSAEGASPPSTIPTTSSETKDSNDIAENATFGDEKDKPEPLGFGDCDPYEPKDYYVDPSDPDEDTEAGPCRDEFHNWQKCIELAKEREEDHMFACRCSVTTEIMAKCISLHPEYYDFDSQKNGNDKD